MWSLWMCYPWLQQSQRNQNIQCLRDNASLKQKCEIDGRCISAIEAHCYQSRISLLGNNMRHNLYEGALKAYDKAIEINHVHAHSWYDKSLLLACWSDIIMKKYYIFEGFEKRFYR